MSAYRYLLFPHGHQPTMGEVGELESFADALPDRFAYGKDRKSGNLAIAFPAEAFEQALENHIGFKALIHTWQRHGATVVEHLGFVKDTKALHPVSTNPYAPTSQHLDLPSQHHAHVTTHDKLVAAKELAAREALGRARLGLQQTVQRHQVLHFFAGWVPYLLIAGGTLLTILAGTYTYQRLSDSGVESRKETIERIADDAVQEPSGELPVSIDEEPVP